MNFGLDISYKLKHHCLFFISAFLIFYFVFNIFCGERNIYRYVSLKREIAQRQAIAKEYALQKEKLQRKVSYLSDFSLDPDLLDERARAVLNMAADDEFVILE